MPQKPGVKHPTSLAKYPYRGKMVTYQSIHYHVKKMWGKANRCDSEDCQGKSLYYQWANLSHAYTLEPSDWKQLCRSCHAIYDTTPLMREKMAIIGKGKDTKGQTWTRKAVNQLALDGSFLKTWVSALEAANSLGINPSSISSAITGRYEQAGGYRWEHTNKVS